jgi:hypothetical protein
MTTRFATNTRLDLSESDDKRHEPSGKRPNRKERKETK